MTHLKTTVAILALTAGTAFAGSNTATDAEVKADTAMESAAEETNELANDAAEATEDAVDATAEAASDTADAVEGAAEDTAAATAETADELTEETAEAVDPDTASIDTEMTAMVVGDLIGKDVAEANGDVIGEIDYIIRDGEKLAAVIGIGGFLGLGEYTVAIPLEEFNMGSDEEMLTLTSWTQEELEAQPEVDESNLEGLPDDAAIDEMS